MKNLRLWTLPAPGLALVLLFLLLPVGATLLATFGDPKGLFAPYVAFFNSAFRRAVLLRFAGNLDDADVAFLRDALAAKRK